MWHIVACSLMTYIDSIRKQLLVEVISEEQIINNFWNWNFRVTIQYVSFSSRRTSCTYIYCMYNYIKSFNTRRIYGVSWGQYQVSSICLKMNVIKDHINDIANCYHNRYQNPLRVVKLVKQNSNNCESLGMYQS